MSSTPPWAQELPVEWSVKPLKALANYFVSNVDKVPSDEEQPVRLCNYSDVYNNEFISASLDLMSTTATPDEIEKYRLTVGDVVITKDSEDWRDIAVPALVVESAPDLVCGYHLAVIRPKSNELTGRFLLRCLQSKQLRLPLELASTGVTRFGLPKGEIGILKLPVPPLPEQNRIAAFLDAETARIDALIAEKQRMLALLDEKRQALISQAVTQGLNPDAPMKPSGQEWLGNIPAHWNLVRLKYLLDQIDQGRSPEAYNQPARDWEWGVLKTSCVNKGVFSELENKALPDSYEPDPAMQVREGDVLMSRASGSPSLLGSVAKVVSPPYTNLMLSDKTFRLAVNDRRMLPDYFVLSMAAPYARAQIENAISGADGLANNISKESINELLLLSPPLDEQQATLAHVYTVSSTLQALSQEVHLSASLLSERRSTLIANAVTGSLVL